MERDVRVGEEERVLVVGMVEDVVVVASLAAAEEEGGAAICEGEEGVKRLPLVTVLAPTTLLSPLLPPPFVWY